MSQIEIPISGQVVWSTGDVRLWVNIGLHLKDHAGNFIPEIFRLDTGTEITTFPAYNARLLNLPMPAKASSGITHTQTGLEIRSGFIRFQVAGLDQTEYALPCLFLGNPAVPPPSTRPAAFPRKLLQPFALLDSFVFNISKNPSVGSLYGDFVVAKK
jgi:hypothetical protein